MLECRRLVDRLQKPDRDFACLIMKVKIHLFLPVLATFAFAITPENAEAAFTTLQQWYNESIGLWIPSTGW